MKILSCSFNMDTACVELKMADDAMIYIDCTSVENEIADNMYQRSALYYLIYVGEILQAVFIAILKIILKSTNCFPVQILSVMCYNEIDLVEEGRIATSYLKEWEGQ